MRPHPRIRKTVKWGGAVVTVLLAVVWVGSGGLQVGWNKGDGIGASVRSGQFLISYLPRASKYMPRGWFGYRYNESLRWGFEWHSFEADGWGVRIPIWWLAGACLAASAIAWRLDFLVRRRDRAGKCFKCGYDRAGLAGGAVCPECGAAGPVAVLNAKAAESAKGNEQGSPK